MDASKDFGSECIFAKLRIQQMIKTNPTKELANKTVFVEKPK
jgi:hypothetical protein